ncbi:alpha/beta hydrolase [Vibrio fluvialis]|nr:alpha/beta hydrolase [Vibrio fluvialis]
MKKIITTLAALLSLSSVQSAPLNYAQLYTHHSSLLNEDREYSVYLPQEYARYPNQHFPVLYLLDGDQRLLQVAGIVHSFRSGLTPAIPAMIIVAIHNTDRMRDYTPSHTTQLPNGESAGPSYVHTGGGPKFLQYLTQELRPDIERQFRTTAPNLLVGHSLGGLLALDSVARDKGAFQGYISIDASLWFDYPSNYQRIEHALITPLKHRSSLYIAVANNPYTPGFGRSAFHRDHLKAFAESVNAHPAANLDVTFHYYENDDHHSVYHPAVYQGLQWLFRGYQLDLSPGKLNRDQVVANYQALNFRLGSQLAPDSDYLNMVINKAKRWPQMQIDANQAQAVKDYFDSESQAEK